MICAGFLVITAIYQTATNGDMPYAAGLMAIGTFFMGASFATSYEQQDNWLFPLRKQGGP
jgi:hypothetical protein